MIRWRRLAAAEGSRTGSFGDRSQGEESALWGYFGATQLKRLKLINPCLLITGLAIRAPPAHLLLCSWGSCQSQSWGIVLWALVSGEALWAGGEPGQEGAGGEAWQSPARALRS